MVGFGTFIAASRQADGTLRSDVPDDWRQGRTAYGGLSAAIAYNTARGVGPDLPPLRSAQIAFIGPMDGSMHASAALLRRGRSSAFVETRIASDAGLGLIGNFLFMAERPSAVSLDAARMPSAPLPEDAEPAMRGKGPAYRGQLEYRHAAAMHQRGMPELLRWVRLRNRADVDPVSEVLLIADALPAAVMPLFEIPPLVSSANWTVNLHTSQIAALDGWWLVQTRAESASGGISNQSMAVWNRAGQQVLSGSQTVSVFTTGGGR